MSFASLRLFVLGGAFLSLVACSSPSDRRRPQAADRSPPQPSLAGTATYFAGNVRATATLNAFRLPRLESAPGGEGGSRGPARGAFGGGPPPGGGAPAGRGAGGGMMRLPRQSLTVTFHNDGPVPVTLAVIAVKSLLGSFVPVPEVLTLEPGATTALESMRGSAGNLSRLDLNLTLRRDDVDETHTITLAPIAADDAADQSPVR